MEVFNRLLAKHVKPRGWTKNTHFTVPAERITSRQEEWTTEMLAALRRGHGSTAGEDFDCPIIVAGYDGERRLLDGNHRVNRWIEAGDTALHRVNIHIVTGTAEHVELPDRRNGA
jgi:hypothetical protein